MSTSPTRVPKYRHYKPKNLAVVRIEGRDYYLGKFDSPESHERYRRVIAEWLTTSTSSRPSRPDHAAPVPSGITISGLILDYWRHAERHYRGRDGKMTQELENMRDAIRPLRRLYGSTDVASFGPLALRAIQQEMIKSGLGRTTINARINRIRRVFKWGVGMEIVPSTIYLAIQTVAPLMRGRTEALEPEGVTPVPIEHVNAVLPYLSRPVAAMVRLQLLTGCRTEEILAIRGCDLAREGHNWEYKPSTHKNAWRGQQRVIPLGPQAQAIIKEFLTDDHSSFLFSPRNAVQELHIRRGAGRKTKRTPSELTRRSKSPGHSHSRSYNRRSYRQAIIRACRRAGIPEWTPIQLRHTAATIIRARFGLEAAQTVLGHAKADVTQIYAERDLARAHSIMAEIG